MASKTYIEHLVPDRWLPARFRSGRRIDKLHNQPDTPLPMRVLCLGLSRTGTKSLFTALERLGYKPMHGSNALRDNRAPVWVEALRCKYRGFGKPYGPPEFRKLLANHDAVLDMPAVLFVDELLETYPNVPVVLTVRDVNKWVESMRRTAFVVFSWRGWNELIWYDKTVMGPIIDVVKMCLVVWAGGEEHLLDAEAMRDGFEAHYAYVRKVVPKYQLLEFHPSDGWEPLCRHLGLERVPDEPFPFINEADSLVKELRGFWYIAWGYSVIVTIMQVAIFVVVGKMLIQKSMRLM